MAETFGVEDRGAFYDAVGALRDVVQNHLLQVVAVLAMELPDRADAQSWQDARVAALAALQPISPELVVCGQYDGYRDIQGVAPDSQTETFIALRFEVDTPRWRGVPFCVRAGKRLPLTTTEVYARYAPPAGVASASHVRARLGPGAVDIGVGLGSLQQPRDADATELRADASYAERADGVLAAWQVVEPAVHAPLPVHRYARGSWGPAEADRVLPAGERWHDPAPSD